MRRSTGAVDMSIHIISFLRAARCLALIWITPPANFALIWIKACAREIAEPFFMKEKARLRLCPVCRLAMVASKSREDLERSDLFRCLRCGTEIVETPRQPQQSKDAPNKA